MTRALVVWQWSDGKRGHERQCQGLVEALAERVALDHRLLAVPASALARVHEFVAGKLPAQAALPNPDLIIGAGRACGLPMLASRRARGGRVICIMRPQLPRRCFDLCIIPRHDGVAAGDRVIISEGPLNPMRPALQREMGLGVMLLGGPSAHHGWNEDHMRAQIQALLAARSDMRWIASDSRRTPAALESWLGQHKQLEYFSHRTTSPQWLPALLARAEQVWVSADSVSMIYEALTAGARVGLLEVPPRRADRIAAIAADLRARGLVMNAGDECGANFELSNRLREAERIADALLARWPALQARL